MVNFPQIFGNLEKAVKATFVAGVAIVQAHPVVAACTVVVVVVGGLTFYYYKNKKNKEKEDDLTYASGRSNDQPGNNEKFYYDPQTKTVTDVPPSNTTDSIRKRGKVVHDWNSSPEENVDSDMSGQEKVIRYLKNVSQTDSTASTSHSVENLNENCINLLRNLVSSNQNHAPFDDISISSDTELRSGSSVTSVLSGESDQCRACDNPVNVRIIPCNHRYLCHDCAERILRIYKKCKICRSKIESFCVELSSFG